LISRALVLKYATTFWLAWQKIYGFAEIVESFLTRNEGKTKTVQCVTMENISHLGRINKFHIKGKGSLTQINAASVLQYQEREERQNDRIRN
jgi:hypothetical protein